jgi:hypothetical protein
MAIPRRGARKYGIHFGVLHGGGGISGITVTKAWYTLQRRRTTVGTLKGDDQFSFGLRRR